MGELIENTVVEHNDLIKSVAKMDNIPLKLFELAISCIDTSNPPKDNVVKISKKEIFKMFNVSYGGINFRFKSAMKSLTKESVFETVIDDKDVIIAPISYVEWSDETDEVSLEFNRRIMPFLVDLKSNFTQFPLSEIMPLESKYGVILFKWLTMSYNQYDTYKNTNKRTQSQLDALLNPTITVAELRKLTATQNEYKRIYDFEKRVLVPAISGINQSTRFNIEFQKIKKGTKVNEIKFSITTKPNWKNENYKKGDTNAQLSIEEKKNRDNQLYVEAMSSPYTTLLLAKGLITPADVVDKETMIKLRESVYPVYKSIESELSSKELEHHLSYVYSKRINYDDNKKNIAKYLYTSGEQFLGASR